MTGTPQSRAVGNSLAAAESAELREAKKRVRLLVQENETLRRAAAFFARESLPR